jgi:hypothetical protein
MIFRLRSDWQNIITRAWSVRLMLLSAVLSGTATGLTIAQPYLGVNPLSVAGIVGVATTVASIIAIYARIVKQQGF